jgi:hypothetical protein
LEWKKARLLVNEDFFKRLSEFNPFGPKEGDFKAYQRLRFIERILDGIEPEHVDDYSIALGKLYRWMIYAIELRKEDVQKRKDNKQRLKDDRLAIQDAFDERLRNRTRDCD